MTFVDVLILPAREKFFSNLPSLREPILFACSLLIIFSDNRIWMGAVEGLGNFYGKIEVLFVFFSIVLLLVRQVRRRVPFFARYMIPLIVYYLTLVWWYRTELLNDVPVKMLLLGILFFLVLHLNKEEKQLLLTYFVGIFAAVMLYGLLFSFLLQLDPEIPYLKYQPAHFLKRAYGFFYETSLFAAVITRVGSDALYTGIFDEAGALGTYAALLFIVYDLATSKTDSKYEGAIKVLLFVEGIATTSYAFVLLLVVYIVFRALIFKERRDYYGLLGIALLFLMLLLVQIDNNYFERFQTRILDTLTSFSVQDNRMSEAASLKIAEFFHSDSSLIIFGNGTASFEEWAVVANADASSILVYFYDYGLVGLVLYFFSILFIWWYSGKKSAAAVLFLAIFCLSAYQRPEVFSPICILLLIFGGMIFKQAPKKKKISLYEYRMKTEMSENEK